MSGAGIISARRQAEEAVADMADGPLKVKAFEVILNSLLRTDAPQLGEGVPAVQLSRNPRLHLWRIGLISSPKNSSSRSRDLCLRYRKS